MTTACVALGKHKLGQVNTGAAFHGNGAAHLASAYGTPSVVLFGPAPPEIWGPPPGPHIVLTRAELRRGDTFAHRPDPALLAVTVQDVLAAVGELGVL